MEGTEQRQCGTGAGGSVNVKGNDGGLQTGNVVVYIVSRLRTSWVLGRGS